MRVKIDIACDKCGKALTINHYDNYDKLQYCTIEQLVQKMYILDNGVYCSDKCYSNNDNEELDISI